MPKKTPDLLSRVPPQSLDAEQSVLGAVLIDNALIARVEAVLDTEDFYLAKHQQIYAAMLHLDSQRVQIDAITLCDTLKSREQLEGIGGAGYVAELAAVVPTTANVDYYAGIVRRKAILRALATEASRVASAAFDASGDVDLEKFLMESEAAITGVCRRQMGAPSKSLDDRITDVMGRRREVRAISTGFPKLDSELQGGFRRGDLVVLAARPSVGKTALALNMCTHVSRGGALFLSVEMRDDQLIERALSDLSGVNWREFEKRDDVWESEVERVTFAGAALGQMNLEILKRRQLKPREVRRDAILASHKWDGKLDLVVIDYLQLMKPDEKQDSKNYDIAEITSALKDLAEELDCAVLLLSQLSREVSKRGGSGMPMLEDLRDSGAVEQDADVVIFLWRRAPGKGEVDDLDKPVQVTIAKHRNGPLGTMDMDFDRAHTRFRERAL